MNMFYERDEEELKLNFGNCCNSFDESKLLPCGDSIRQSCLSSIISKCENVKIKCSFCSAEQKVPSEGSSRTQKLIDSMMPSKPSKLYRGKLYKDTLRLFDKLVDYVKRFDKAVSEEKQKITTYCQGLKNTIEYDELTKREVKQALLNEVHAYEIKCLQNVDKPSTLQRDYLRHLSAYAKKVIEQIRQVLSDAEITEEVTQMWHDFLVNACEYSRNGADFHESLIFNGLLLKVNRDESENTSRGNLQISYEEFWYQDILNIDRFKSECAYSKLNYESFLHSFPDQVVESVWLSFVNLERLVIVLSVRCLRTNEFGIRIKLMDKNGELMGKNDENRNCELVAISASDKNILIVLKNMLMLNQVYLYDINLKLSKIATLDFEPISVHRTKASIFIQANKAPYLHAYDWNLKKVKEFGQNTMPNEPYYMIDVAQIFIKTNKIFVRDSDNLTVRQFSLFDGKLIAQVHVNMSDCLMHVDSIGRLILINQDNKILYIYDTVENSKILFEYDLTYVRDISSFSITFNGHLIVNDTTDKIMYIV